MYFIDTYKFYDPDALAYFAQLTVQPSAAYKNAVNTLVRQLKADGNWTKLDRLWIHATEQQQHARVSLKNPTSTQLTEVNTPTWTLSQGYTGNGATTYLNTEYNPNLDATSYLLNDACMFVYSRSNVAANSYDIGCTGASSARIGPRLAANLVGGAINNLNVQTAANADSSGFFAAQRTAANAFEVFRNGASLLANATASTSVPNQRVYLLAFNNAGVAASFSTRQIAISGLGGSLNQVTFYTAIQAFATTIGFNV